jgi:Cyclic nucleotide-binding domain
LAASSYSRKVALPAPVRQTVPVYAATDNGGLLAGALRAHGRLVRFRRGQALFTQGDRAERVFAIERGWVMITSLAPGGREIVLGLRGPGDLIGDLSALDGAPRSATALAVGEVEATVAPSSALIRALADVWSLPRWTPWDGWRGACRS